MPPPFPVYLLISSGFAAGFFVLLGLILSGLVRLNTNDAASPAALLFYGAFLFTGVLRIIKDAWAYWPYAFHSGKFLRHTPESGAGYSGWLRMSPGFAAGVSALLFVGCCAYLLRSLGFDFSAGVAPAWMPSGVARELLFWLPGLVLIPATLFLLMLAFGVLFVRSYANFSGEPRPMSANRALLRGLVFPEALAFLTLNAAILWPLGAANVFAVNADAGFGANILAALPSGIGLVAFSTAALWLSIVTPATPALTGAVFSRLWRLEKIDGLSTPAPLPEAGAHSFRFRDYFVPVFAINCAIFCVWRALGSVAPDPSGFSFAWFLAPAEAVWLAAFVYFRRRVLAEDLQRVSQYYRSRPYFYIPGPALAPADLPAELAA
ncbi:MAG: hypothetical protein NXI24_17520 [bacterium]|nr:hypothetical protein [bacterium]